MKVNARRSVAICCAIGLLASLFAAGTTAQTSSPWVFGPILGAIGDNVAVISWETSRPVSIDLHYGLAQVHEGSASWSETLTFDRQEGNAEIWLRDLIPNSEYRYQLIAYEGDAVYPSKLGSFRTAAASARAFTFVVYGHTRSFPDRHKLVADIVARDEETAAFVVHVGELVESLTPDRTANFRWAIADLARSVPYLAVVGSEATNTDEYYQAFALPQGGGTSGEEWWSFDYGSVHLIGLNSTFADPSNDRAQEQLVWLRQDLSTSTAELTVVLCAASLYGSAHPSGRNEPLASLWEPVFRAGGVDLVLSGETGVYEHVYAGGIHHITTGGGGGPLAVSPDERVPGLVFSRYGVLHYIRITVADDALRAEAVPVASVIDDEIYLTPSGKAIDSFVIRAPTE